MSAENGSGGSLPEDQQPRVIPLGPHWVATVFPSGEVVVQQISDVVVCGTHLRINMREERDSALEKMLKDLEPERFAVRAVLLRQDGAVLSDLFGISGAGEITEAAHEILPSMVDSVPRYYKHISDGEDW